MSKRYYTDKKGTNYYLSRSKYVPAGAHKNVNETSTVKPKIAADMNKTFNLWNDARIARQA